MPLVVIPADKKEAFEIGYSATYLSKDKRCVMFEVDVARADGVDRGGATAEGALARFLGSRVNSLPASMTRREVWSRHPAVVPHMEVPGRDKRFRAPFKSDIDIELLFAEFWIAWFKDST